MLLARILASTLFQSKTDTGVGFLMMENRGVEHKSTLHLQKVKNVWNQKIQYHIVYFVQKTHIQYMHIMFNSFRNLPFFHAM